MGYLAYVPGVMANSDLTLAIVCVEAFPESSNVEE
jgi:hypothetical protein